MENNIKINIRYDGEALKGRAIDIDVLGKSLASLHKLMELASEIIYGHEKKISIKANANIKQNCFELLLEFSGNLAGSGTTLFSSHFGSVELRALLNWVGVKVADYSEAGNDQLVKSLFHLIKLFQGKNIDQKQIISKAAQAVNVRAEDGSEVHINQNTYNLYVSHEARKATQEFFGPLKREGIEKIELEADDEISQVIEKKDFHDFLYRKIGEDVNAPEPLINVTTRNLTVHMPVLDKNAKRWYFWLGEKSIKVDISNTNISKEAYERGLVRIGDTYMVELEEKEYEATKGRHRYEYKILKVLKFKKGRREQLDL